MSQENEIKCKCLFNKCNASLKINRGFYPNSYQLEILDRHENKYVSLAVTILASDLKKVLNKLKKEELQ